MANTSLISTQDRNLFFHQTVLANLHYWREWLKAGGVDVPALDRERNTIVRAISFALELDEAWPSVRNLIEMFSQYMERQGYWDIWNRVLARSLSRARQLTDLEGEVSLSVLSARLAFQQSHFTEAVTYYRRTMRIARQVEDRFNEARACTNLGYHYVEQGRWYRAEVLCCYALKLFEQIGSEYGCAHTENHLGFLYSLQHRLIKAAYHLNRACTIWQRMNDNHGLMRGLINLSGLYLKMKQPDTALSYLEKALHYAQTTGEKATIGRIYTNMGMAYRLAGDYLKAEDYNRQAETLFRQSSNHGELARVYNGLGLTYFHQGRWDEAILNLENSLNVWRSLGNQIEEVEVLFDLAECEISQGYRQTAGVRLREVEHLIGQNNDDARYSHFQSRLTKLRHSLPDE